MSLFFKSKNRLSCVNALQLKKTLILVLVRQFSDDVTVVFTIHHFTLKKPHTQWALRPLHIISMEAVIKIIACLGFPTAHCPPGPLLQWQQCKPLNKNVIGLFAISRGSGAHDLWRLDCSLQSRRDGHRHAAH